MQSSTVDALKVQTHNYSGYTIGNSIKNDRHGDALSVIGETIESLRDISAEITVRNSTDKAEDPAGA